MTSQEASTSAAPSGDYAHSFAAPPQSATPPLPFHSSHPKNETAAPSKKAGRQGISTSTAAKGFWFSGIACCVAEAVTIPVDTVKTRLQLQGELGSVRLYNGAFDAAGKMVRQEGPFSLFKGLTPALLRQATYGTLRYGLYEPIKKLLSGNTQTGQSTSLGVKLASGTLAGLISAGLCNPTDLIKVRMQADISRPLASGVSHTPRYRNTLHAFSSIYRAEGLKGLYRGVGPTCGRAAVGAATELATYDELKHFLLSRGLVQEGLNSHLCASLVAGFVSTLCNSPFDVVKSRVMNQKTDATGKGVLYRGMTDCFVKSVQAEGVLSLWKGFWPNYARVGPRVVIIFVVIEQLRELFD